VSGSGVSSSDGRTALVVEDDVLLAFLVKDFLLDLGIVRTELAHDVDSAMQLVGNPLVDVAVVNWRVGQTTSLALIERLNGLGRKVLISTGLDQSSVPNAIRQHNKIIMKPFDLPGFRSALDALDHHRD